MTKKIAILQSNYIPWKGYFDMISSVDEFVLYDDMQYTKNDWRNRNTIKTKNGLQWLTIPVVTKGKFGQTIRETQISNNLWQIKHWKSICQNYRKSKYFDEITLLLEPLYIQEKYLTLSQCNRKFLEFIGDYLGIDTKISNSWDYDLVEGKSEKLVNICLQAGATEYVSGPAAKEYLDVNLFEDAGIKVTWFDYSGYPKYEQLWDGFAHNVSIVDLLFNQGVKSNDFLIRKII
ncbi:WbqC family protein [Vibrio diazotrophicus]|uniref:WbqC family protein n=2 Tax=Vibrio diazotrophicus TaxID=685 RepID=UPI0005A8D28A|nr:WbqC family protein [Vibrio diazotrophicus]